MIRPLRKRHGWMIVAIGIVVGALAIAGLLLRPEPAIQDDLPASLRMSPRLGFPEDVVHGGGGDVSEARPSRAATP